MEFPKELTALYNKYKDVFTKHNVKLSIAEPMKFSAEAKMSDGTVVMTTADAFGPGVDIYKMGESGEPEALAMGEYTLETGEVVIVGEDGKVAEIKVKEAEMSTEDAMTIIQGLSDRITQLETNLSAITTERDTTATKMAEVESNLKTTTAELAALKLKAAAPSTKEVEAGKFRATHDEPVKVGSPEYFKSIMEKAKKGTQTANTANMEARMQEKLETTFKYVKKGPQV